MMDHDAVNYSFDRMDLVPIQGDLVIHGINRSVNADTDKPRFADIIQDRLISTLPGTDNRSEDHDPCPIRQRSDGISDFLSRLLGDFTAANRTMRNADTGKHQTEIVIDLRNGTDCRPGIAGSAFLVNGNRRREPFDDINIGFVHLTEKLACIGRKGFDITPLPFGKDRIKRKR